MKFLCDSCSRLVEMDQYRIEGSVLVATCSACGASSRAALPRAAPMEAAPPAATPVAPPAEVVPTPPIQRAPVSPLPHETGLADDLEQQWKDLLGRWDDPEAHKKFVVIAGARDALAEVGRRYRLRAEAGDPHAAQGRDEVVKHAISLAMTQSPTEKRAVQGGAALALSAIVLVGFLIVYVVWKALR